MHGEGDLVELDALAARDLGAVLGRLALLEALEDLALAAGVAERAATGVDLGVEAVERQRGVLVLALERLEPALLGEQVGRAGARALLRAAVHGGLRQAIAGRGEHRRALEALVQGGRE